MHLLHSNVYFQINKNHKLIEIYIYTICIQLFVFFFRNYTLLSYQLKSKCEIHTYEVALNITIDQKLCLLLIASVYILFLYKVCFTIKYMKWKLAKHTAIYKACRFDEASFFYSYWLQKHLIIKHLN